MPYVKTINEDGVVSDIMAVALDPTLDATLIHTSNLVDGFTQTEAGVNALDAAAGKSLNDSFTWQDITSQYASSDTSKITVSVAHVCKNFLYLQLNVVEIPRGWTIVNITGPYLPAVRTDGIVNFTSQSLLGTTFQATMSATGQVTILSDSAITGNATIRFLVPISI